MKILTLSQAAKVANKSKSTLLEAIRSSRLKAFKNDKNQWQIDPNDLFKLYPQTEHKPVEKTDVDPSLPNNRTVLLRQQVESLEQRVNDIKDERDDLRRRLNEEAEERRKLTEWMTKVLDDYVPSLVRILNLTPEQYNIFTILVKGYYVITESYIPFKELDYHPPLNPEIINDLTNIGVLNKKQVSERFKQVTNSILQDRGIKEITLNDLMNLAIRYSEWKKLPLRFLPHSSLDRK